MTDALKPCPFCGERPCLTVRPDNAEESTYFAAVSCYCDGYSACAHKMATAPEAAEAESLAVAAWNRRALPAAPPVPAGTVTRASDMQGVVEWSDKPLPVGAVLYAATAQPVPATGAQPAINDALAAYWDAAYAEGKEGRTHDTADGTAQKALAAVKQALAATAQPAPAPEVAGEPVARMLRLAEDIDPLTRKRAPDHLTVGAAAKVLRELASLATSQPAPAAVPADIQRDAARYRWLRSVGAEQQNVIGHYAEAEMDKMVDKHMAAAPQQAPTPHAGEKL